MLAQDEYNHLSNALATLTTSRTSRESQHRTLPEWSLLKLIFVLVCSSSSSVSTKYDPDLLKSDVAMAKDRVSRLKLELEKIRNEMTYTQRGVDTLTR